MPSHRLLAAFVDGFVDAVIDAFIDIAPNASLLRRLIRRDDAGTVVGFAGRRAGHALPFACRPASG